MGSLLYLFSLHFIFLTPPPTGYTVETMSSTDYICTGYSRSTVLVKLHAGNSTLQIDDIVYILCRSTWHDKVYLYVYRPISYRHFQTGYAHCVNVSQNTSDWPLKARTVAIGPINRDAKMGVLRSCVGCAALSTLPMHSIVIFCPG